MRYASRTVLVTSLFCALFVLATGPAQATSTEWPHLRGPALDGRISGTELFRGETGLALAWRIPLGLGYSGIAVADGVAVTLYSDGTDDVVLAVDAATGKEVWRRRIDNTYKAKDGSDGGPLSTPLIHNSVVYALGPNGQLFALNLADGKEIWKKMLPADFDAKAPHFGFTTTPVVEGNVLVLQTGGADGKAIVGLDIKTGKILWSLGDAEVEYQSPAVMSLAGQRQVVAISGHQINGIDPASGKVLWEHSLGEEAWAGSANPTPIGDDRFLAFVAGAAVVYGVSKDGDGFAIEEQYKTRDLGGTYALPVLHEGHLYGFKGQFLTCVNAENGEQVWKSRPPGGRGLILVDGHLVIFAAKGNVVIAEASPEGYKEKASLTALSASSLTWPSFAGNKIFLRTLTEMAAIQVTTGSVASMDMEKKESGTPDSQFARFVSMVEASDSRDDLVKKFLQENETFPLIEDGYLHFIYVSEEEIDDIAVASNIIDRGSADSMTPIAGTNLYYKTYGVEPGTRWEYRFILNYENPIVDPRNPSAVPARRGDAQNSEVAMPGHEAPRHIAEPAGARGTVESFQFASKMLEDEREVKVYLPAGYDAEGDSGYPLFVVHGHDWLEKGLMANTLDNLIGKRVAPVVVAFVAPRDEWWLEAGGTGTVEYADMLAQELVPHLQKKYTVSTDSASTAVMGNEGFGVAAAYASLKYPKVFGKVAVQSVSLGMGTEDALMELVNSGKGTNVRFYLDWNRYEIRAADSAFNLREDSQRLASALEAGGYDTAGGEAMDAYGWGSWRARSDLILEDFFPLR